MSVIADKSSRENLRGPVLNRMRVLTHSIQKDNSCIMTLKSYYSKR